MSAFVRLYKCAGTACAALFLISPTPSWPRERILCGTSAAAAGDTLIIFNKSCFPWAPHIIVVCCWEISFHWEIFRSKASNLCSPRALVHILASGMFYNIVCVALREALAQAVIARRLRKLCVRSSFIRAIYPRRAAAAAYVLFRSWTGPSPGCSAEISRLENFSRL